MNTPLPHCEFPHFNSKLRARLDALRGEIRATLLRTDSEQYAQLAGQVHDAGDEALADVLVDVNLAEITRDVQEVRDVDAALRRIATGVYGVCTDCYEPVGRERLEAYPTAKRCLECQRIHDRTRATAPTPSL